MGLPSKRRSRSKIRRNRAHEALTLPKLTTCPECKSAKKPHHVCPVCGVYKKSKVTAK